MDAKQAIILARKHVADDSANESSARACLADAVGCYDSGMPRAAFRWALKSLSYSVGVFHADYKKVSDALTRSGYDLSSIHPLFRR